MTYKLSKKDYNLLSITIDSPLGIVFKSNHYFLDKYGVSEAQLENMNEFLDSLASRFINDEVSFEFSEEKLKELIKCFKASKIYLGQEEFSTFTGFEWNEAENLEKKLENMQNK